MSPLVRSPYSTEGIPRTISTWLISSVVSERISTPIELKSRAVTWGSHAFLRLCRLALLLMGAPSIRKLVPSEDVAYCSLLLRLASLSRILFGRDRLGSWLRPPGSSSSKSLKLEGCRCSIACLRMVEALVSPLLSWAVTMTSCIALISGFSW